MSKKKSVYLLLGMIALLMVYFIFEELMGSLLMVFSDHFVSKKIFGFEVPTSVLLIMNPLTIILIGPLIAKIPLHTSKKLPLAWVCLAAAFSLLYVGCVAEPVSPFFLLGSFSLIALGELLIAPTVYTHAAQFAPPELKGIMMSLVTLGFAYGSLISGTLSQQMHLQTISEYSRFFLYAILIAGFVAFAFILKKQLLKFSKIKIIREYG